MTRRPYFHANNTPARLGNEPRRFSSLCILVLIVFAASTRAEAENPAIVLLQNNGDHAFRLNNLTPSQLGKLSLLQTDDGRLAEAYAVYATPDPSPDFPAMSGSYRLAKNALVFTPRYPLQPGLTYTALYKDGSKTLLTQTFTLPKAPPGPPARVTAVYPSSDTLPENLLRFYFHFSKPMSRGQAYRRITLFDHNTGQVVDRPFLELEEELWDPGATRFTLLFDPGRVKEGLTPRLEVGPSLMRDHKYTLRIDAAWLDAKSNPMAETFDHTFNVVEPDTTQPDIARWKLTPPHVGSAAPLSVRFGEPLDRGQLHRLLTIEDAAGRPVTGSIAVDQHETRWRFTPDQPWTPGVYQLVAATILEDRAANSLGRPFEVDMDKRDHAKLGDFVSLKFEVGPAVRD